MVKDIHPSSYSSNPSWLTNVNGTLFFGAVDGTHGVELWKSDGTEAGTVMVKDISPSSTSSGPRYLTNIDGVLFFNAWDETHGRELWKSDGTEAGTVMVKDINPGAAASMPEDQSFEFTITSMNGPLFFTADDGVHGRELWKSDGTEAGTVMVKDIHPSWGWPKNLTNVDGTLFFAADDNINGLELWKSDGTETGTVMVGDLLAGQAGSEPEELTNVNGTLFFISWSSYSIYEKQLWTSDGTQAGTFVVKHIDSDVASLSNGPGVVFEFSQKGGHG